MCVLECGGTGRERGRDPWGKVEDARNDWAGWECNGHLSVADTAHLQHGSMDDAGVCEIPHGHRNLALCDRSRSIEMSGNAPGISGTTGASPEMSGNKCALRKEIAGIGTFRKMSGTVRKLLFFYTVIPDFSGLFRIDGLLCIISHYD